MKNFILYSILIISIGCTNKLKVEIANVVKKLNYNVSAQTILNDAVILQLNVPMTTLSNPVAENNATLISYSAKGLPPGLLLNNNNGTISGTPTVIGIYSVKVIGISSTTSKVSYQYLVDIYVNNELAPSSLIYPTPNNHSLNTLESIPVTSVIGSNLTFSESGLPPGYTVDPVTGLISGTYIGIGGDFIATITATNVDGSTNALVTILFPCDPAYTKIAGVCIQNLQSRSCTSQPSNSTGGTESTINAGSSWNSCSGYSCVVGYTDISGVCTQDLQSRLCSPQPANSTGGNESTIDAGQNWGLCAGFSCNNTYTNVGGSCVLENQTRSCSPQPANSTGGTESTNDGGVIWNSCAGFVCSNGYTYDPMSDTCTTSNNTPTASDFQEVTLLNTPLTATVSANDADGNTLSYSIVSNGSNGSAVMNSSTGSFTYTPTNGYVGLETITFKVNDGIIDSATHSIKIQVGCPDGYVQVPKNIGLGVTGFCIMSNEAIEKIYGTGGAATSLSSQTNYNISWINITVQAAKDACKAIGPKYDLTSNAEWMTMARNIEAVASNWSSGIVGTGKLAKGHSDGAPDVMLNKAEATIDPYTGTGDSSGTKWDQRRTHTLSNGSVIWDLSGNAREWVDWIPDGSATVTKAPHTASCDSAYDRHLHAVPLCTNPFPVDTYAPGNPAGVTPINYDQSYNLGSIWGNDDPAFGYAVRGGTEAEPAFSGIFALSVWWGLNETDNTTGFRCVYRPFN